MAFVFTLEAMASLLDKAFWCVNLEICRRAVTAYFSKCDDKFKIAMMSPGKHVKLSFEKGVYIIWSAKIVATILMERSLSVSPYFLAEILSMISCFIVIREFLCRHRYPNEAVSKVGAQLARAFSSIFESGLESRDLDSLIESYCQEEGLVSPKATFPTNKVLIIVPDIVTYVKCYEPKLKEFQNSSSYTGNGLSSLITGLVEVDAILMGSRSRVRSCRPIQKTYMESGSQRTLTYNVICWDKGQGDTFFFAVFDTRPLFTIMTYCEETYPEDERRKFSEMKKENDAFIRELRNLLQRNENCRSGYHIVNLKGQFLSEAIPKIIDELKDPERTYNVCDD